MMHFQLYLDTPEQDYLTEPAAGDEDSEPSDSHQQNIYIHSGSNGVDGEDNVDFSGKRNSGGNLLYGANSNFGGNFVEAASYSAEDASNYDIIGATADRAVNTGYSLVYKDTWGPGGKGTWDTVDELDGYGSPQGNIKQCTE